ncbi:Putative phosphoserine phosphatase 2 [Variovorax sp. PBS-H4]|uniref:histidine phosphatase family protein n=1 Tax=Variovorax sp. PBS-H4 TaxID=434008 RepID=UPI001318F01E|nr:histidine phosphatase family protein [Variovorax sp. PBS-H4]VTU31480.1 Putative phosphoserine phosphatase 2 [Variovorax sp. PBS-H4]
MNNGLARLIELAKAQPLAPACDHFYFLRHGQTEGNAQRIFQAVDTPLSTLGLTQAARAAERLAGEPIRSVVCSDARRASDTARTVAAGLGKVPQHFDSLRERDFGALIGTSSAELDWSCEPEGGETLPQFVTRKRAALEAALAHPAPVLIVAHGGSLHVLVAALGIAADPNVLGNAQPLYFGRSGPTWAVRPLLHHSDGGAALA